MTRVKICGLTRAEDVALAVDLGAHYLGFIFVKDSPRCITPEHARTLRRAVENADVSVVGVFRDASVDEVLRIAESVSLDFVQLHGNETYTVGIPTIRAFKVEDALPDTTTTAHYVLFDTGGGTGRTFDWSLLAAYPRAKPFFLAGGIRPDNVAEAVERTRPFAIDIASGVESSPGIKDHHKLRNLFERMQR